MHSYENIWVIVLACKLKGLNSICYIYIYICFESLTYPVSQGRSNTLPKMNIAPDNQCLEDEVFLSDGLFSGGYVSFREGISYFVLSMLFSFGLGHWGVLLKQGGWRNPTASELRWCFQDMLYMFNPTCCICLKKRTYFEGKYVSNARWKYTTKWTNEK